MNSSISQFVISVFVLHHRLALSALAYPFPFSSSGSLFVRQNKYITKCMTELSSLFCYQTGTILSSWESVWYLTPISVLSAPEGSGYRPQSLKKTITVLYKKSPASLPSYCALITELNVICYFLPHLCIYAQTKTVRTHAYFSYIWRNKAKEQNQDFLINPLTLITARV